ncbi:hypothetical protein [Streptomyces sp. NPDC008001]|uniref:hypothetical protein n=1 Tax=Streptomyces sp. NPDC008001 TaxID=3364804 RepID=UPI0036EEEF92
MKQHPARRSLWTPSTFSTATGALVAEAGCTVVALTLWPSAHPSPVTHTGPLSPSEDDSGIFGIVFLPFFLAALTVVAAVLAAVLVIPTASLARRLAARSARPGSARGDGGRDARWWLPALAAPAPVAAAAVLAVTVMSGHPGALTAHPAACLYWWLGATACIVPAGLLTLFADRRAATGRTAWRLPMWLLGGSCLAPVLGVVLVTAGALAYRAVTG